MRFARLHKTMAPGDASEFWNVMDEPEGKVGDMIEMVSIEDVVSRLREILDTPTYQGAFVNLGDFVYELESCK